MFYLKIEFVKSKKRKLKVYNNYFLFPIKPVVLYNLITKDKIPDFVKICAKLLKWA